MTLVFSETVSHCLWILFSFRYSVYAAYFMLLILDSDVLLVYCLYRQLSKILRILVPGWFTAEVCQSQSLMTAFICC